MLLLEILTIIIVAPVIFYFGYSITGDIISIIRSEYRIHQINKRIRMLDERAEELGLPR
jgi:hypothetical protein